MSDPIPWRRETEALHQEVRRARGLLARGFPEPEWPEHARDEAWQRLAARIDRRPGRPWLPGVAVTGWALAAAMGALVVTLRLPPRTPAAAGPLLASPSGSFDERTADWEPLSLGADGNLRVQPGSNLELTAGQTNLAALPTGAKGSKETPAWRVLMREGELCAEVAHRDIPRQGPLVVEAPQMRVIVIGTKFCFESLSGVARVKVSEGRVRVQTPAGMSAEVGAGEEMRSDDAWLRATLPSLPTVPASLNVPPAAAPAVEGCAGAGLSVGDRASCYRHVADGTGLAAQNALYGLGLLARDHQHDGEAAMRYWRDYQRRFPRGVLAPEASLGILGELIAERRYAEAVDEADAYLKSFPDGFIAEVTLAKAEILQTGLNSPDSAIPIYLGLLTQQLGAPVRQEVLYSMGLCEQQEGYPNEANELWRRYLQTFPHGPHAAQVSALLAPQ